MGGESRQHDRSSSLLLNGGLRCLEAPSVIATPKAMLMTGLKLVGCSDGNVERVKTPATNTQRFITHFGVNQIVAAQVFEDLQTSDHEEARVNADKASATHFLQALNFLKECRTEGRREAVFDRSPKII